MPKLKTNASAKKRFKLTKTGKVRRNRAYSQHLLSHKSAKRKRNLRRPGLVKGAQAKTMKRLIGGA